MNLLSMVSKSKNLTNGCKRYYDYLCYLSNKSSENNWKVISGKYENYYFTIPTDTHVSEKLKMGIRSIHNYKKILKSLGLIAILPKCTTRTNQQKNYHNKQLTIVIKSLPKKFISKSLTYFKTAKILKKSKHIISQLKKNLNKVVLNVHTKIKKMLNVVKSDNCTNNIPNNKDVQTIANMLNTYNIKFKINEVAGYVEMYKKSKEKFSQTCKYCSDKDMYAPLKYFTKVFYAPHKPKGIFFNFKQRDYDYEKLETTLVNRFDL